jgi:hypothetical protein
VIALDDGIIPYSSCGSFSDAIDCETAHYWTLQANGGDEIYVNPLSESDNDVTYCTFYEMGSKQNLIQHRIIPLAGENMSRPIISPTFVCLMNLGLSMSMLWPFK